MNDDFFGRPRTSGTTTTAPRPRSTAPAPKKPAPRPATAPTSRAPRRTGPAPVARQARPGRPVRTARPARPAQSSAATRPVDRSRPAARPSRPPRPSRPAAPALTGAELRTRTLRRLIGFVVVMGLIVAAVGLQLVRVQVVGSGRYIAYGDSQRDRLRPLPAGRGAIYDRNGQAFAMSVAQPMVVADPAEVRHPVKTARSLAHILGMDATALEATLKAPYRYRVLAKDVSQRDIAEIKRRLKKHDLAGISLEDEYVRSTPNGDLALGVIGHAMPEGEKTKAGKSGGISGIEAEFDRQLRGKPGKLFYEQDVFGNPIAGGHRKLDPAVQGTDIYLTVDQALQYETEQALKDQVVASGADSAQAVIMRPSTGEILSMASVAADEDGKVANTRDNRPVTSVFEPGSVNKMITIAGAVEDHVVKPGSILHVPDALTLYDKQFTDSHVHPAADWSVTDILVTSSNIGTIKIAQQLGREKVDHYLRSFGFGTTTGLGFPAEEDGIMKGVDEWSGVDIGAMPIGQGISVTALQMLAAYNVVANDGIYVAPRLVNATDHGAGQVPMQPSSGRRVVSADTAAAMRAMLAKVVSDGTGKNATVPGYEAAGKTGTARIAQGSDSKDGYLDENGAYRYQASFVGMVNGADLSIIVTVEDPKTSIFGADIAAPVFSHLAAMALRRYQVPPPALLDAAKHEVPELSASAREVDGEDVTGGAPHPAG